MFTLKNKRFNRVYGSLLLLLIILSIYAPAVLAEAAGSPTPP